MITKPIALLCTDKLLLLTPFLQEVEMIQSLSDDVKASLLDSFTIINAEKDAIILSEGEVSRHTWVVLQGVIRSFHYIGDTEVTSRLMQPHHIIISVESYYTQLPATESLQAIQPSILACLHQRQLNNLYQQFPSLNYIGRKLTEHYLLLTERRLHMLRKQKAIDKYKFFLEEYPALANQIPLKYIASYLGINGETLSRVRNRIR